MSSIKQLLIAARKLIENPEHWTQGVMARNCDGHSTYYRNGGAFCFCASGALQRVQADIGLTFDDLHRSMWILEGFCPVDILHFNDSHTHQEVLNVFDKAIANCG